MDQLVIDLIRKRENARLEQMLTEYPSLAGIKTESGISLLQYAAYAGNTEAVKILRRYRFRIDIFEAASIGDHDILARNLSDNPELLNSFSSDGFTVLGLATYFGHGELVRWLLQKGADPDLHSRNQFNVAPIHSACAVSNSEITEVLISYGADVNARQMNGITPLHSAAHNGQTALAELLILNGAEVNARTDDGQTPLEMALAGSFEETSDLIRRHGGLTEK